MSFKNEYPDFAPVEEYVRQARLERSVAIADMIARAIAAVVNGVGSLFPAPARKPVVFKAHIAESTRA